MIFHVVIITLMVFDTILDFLSIIYNFEKLLTILYYLLSLFMILLIFDDFFTFKCLYGFMIFRDIFQICKIL